MRNVLLYAVFLAVAANAAQSLRAQLLPIRNYTTREGLNANSINAVLRDSKGMLWVGTYNGVNWYDGERFIQPRMTTRSGQIYVMHLMEDHRHQVWVATWYSGIYKYVDGIFSNYMPDTVQTSNQANSITCFTELDSGRYLAGTDRNAWVFDGNNFSLLDSGNAMLNQQIHSILYTHRGDILIGLPEGIARYKKIGKRWEAAGLLLKGVDINKMAAVGDRMWITCSKGLYYIPSIDGFLDAAVKIRSPSDDGPSHRLLLTNPVDDIFPDATGDCWYTEGSIGACLLHNNQPIRCVSKENGLPSSFVKTVFSDGENIVWLGTEYGLAKLTPAGYRFYTMQEAGDMDANVIAIGKDASGTTWLGTYEGLYRMQNGAPRKVVQPNGYPCGFVFNILRDRHGRTWACTASGIYILDNGGIHRQNTAVTTCISEDADGMVWFGGSDGRIFRLDDHGFHEMIQTARIDERIPGISHDKAGFLWAGYSLTGLRKFRISHDSLYLVHHFLDGYGIPLVRTMLADGTGRLLVGTRTGGIYVFDSSSRLTQPLTMDQGLSGNWIKGIAAGKNEVFLATNNGLDIVRSNSTKGDIRHVRFNDGRIPTEFNTIFLQQDTLWLGTARGVLEYAPRSQVRDSQPPPVYCMRAVINGRKDSSFGLFTRSRQLPPLEYAQNNLSFDFAGLAFRNETSVQYRYRLEGLDKDWSPPTDRRYVNYADLSPGQYRFLVIAGNEDGVWSSTPASISFTIEAPFWLTPWFLTLCGLSILALIYGLYRIRLNQLLRIERLRQKISTDLHDDIGSTLSSISILSDMALQEEENTRRAPAPSLPTMIREIHDNSLSLLEKMDDIVWSINPRNDTLESLMLRVRRFGAQLFEARGIEYDIDIEPGIRGLRLRMEHRQHLYLIMKEAINNLVKYAGARKAHIRVHAIRHLLVVRISDDGAGFNLHTARAGNGIINMKDRAAAMKANLDIDTAPGRGTIVTFTLKIS
jgi:ligand-binding sensor domain-containing protein